MSAYSGETAHYAEIEPIYVNEEYVKGVGVTSSRSTHHYDQVIVDECQLIERVRLSSSEREVNKLRLSGDFESKDTDSQPSIDKSNKEHTETLDTPTIEEHADDVFPVEADDTGIYYEIHTDESRLIQYAKLADDGLGEVVKHDVKCVREVGDESKGDLKVSLETSEENAEGFRTPDNSEEGDKITEELKKKLAECYQISRNFEVSDRNAANESKQVALYEEKPTDSNAIIKARQDVVRRNIEADGNTEGNDEPRDPDFSKLVSEVVHHLQDCDLDEMLSMFAGSGILEMTGLVPPAELMKILRLHRFITRDNLFHLQGLIIRLDDTDLFIRAIQYTRHHHDIVYFYQDRDIPTKGFGKVRCFVGGRDFTRLTREDLELVRFKVASLVFMPAHCAYIVGIEPGQKVAVTLMLLERYVQELSEMSREGLAELALVNVDAIQIYGKTYSTAGTTAIEKYREGGHAPFISVYTQLRDKSKRLENRDLEVRQLREEAELKQLELETMGAELEVLTEKALRESVGRHRQRDRQVVWSHPARRHPRARSLPLTLREMPDDREFTRALESAVVTNAEKRVRVTDKRELPKTEQPANTVKRTIYKTGSGRDAIRSGREGIRVPDGPSKALVLKWHTDQPVMFRETNKIMDDIEAILNELALANVK